MSRTAAQLLPRLAVPSLSMGWLLIAILAIGTTDATAVQSASAGLTGTVVDSTGASLAGATVIAIHEATSLRREVQSSSDGSFAISTLAPGRYVVIASHSGFRPSELRDVVLNVDDRLFVRLELAVAGVDEAVTVSSEAQRINTSPGISTVIDRTFVENLPLNGRSLHALLELTPGVVVSRSSVASEGQFSVNGQRANSNYFTIDGVSANVGTSASAAGFLGATGSGQLPGLTALGGTNGLVSVDALQEFRIQTSGYAPEFGRTPGGQVSFATRAGTNVFHGSAFEYFRDDALDATDWFLNRSGSAGSELRQHNFGGVLGGPILRNRTFAFGAYERLDLKIPQARSGPVPTLETRRSAVAALQPYLNALPLPNGNELGSGFATFDAVYSDPSEVDARSLRLDHNLGLKFKLFARISDAPSFSEARAPSFGHVNVTESNTRSGTFGTTWVISDRIVQDVRGSVATAHAPGYHRQDPLGGATLLSPPLLPSGRDPATTALSFVLVGGGTIHWGPYPDSPSRQFNLVDSLTWTFRSHEMKFGIDYRRTDTTTKGGVGRDTIQVDSAGLRSGRLTSLSMIFSDVRDRRILFDNLSIYGQDHWRPTSRLTLSYGIRWELVPPPKIDGVPAATLSSTEDLYGSAPRLESPGTPLWHTTFGNFAPRVGASYLVSENPARSLLIKGGIGTFYDLGYGQVGSVVGWSYPYSFTKTVPNLSLPIDSSVTVPPTLGIDPPSVLTAMDRNLKLPYTLQWSVSAEQAVGKSQSVSVSYVGAAGRRLLRPNVYRVPLGDWPTTPIMITVTRNQGYSDYQALQLQFNRRLKRGLQAIASYTLGRSRDTESSEAGSSVPAERLSADVDYGFSNFDLRHVFTAALTYQVPVPAGPLAWRIVAQDWGVDVMLRAHSGYPINVTALVSFPPVTVFARPNVVLDQQTWLDDPNAPGGRRLNREAFIAPPAQTQGDLPRGAVRGFGLSQCDLALHREVGVGRRLRLQFRFEVFNLFNTPNFADPVGRIDSADFGLSTQMLGRSLGGQNVLYQVGGPRSIQLATKVRF